jgi:hypothetical protein
MVMQSPQAILEKVNANLQARMIVERTTALCVGPGEQKLRTQ